MKTSPVTNILLSALFYTTLVSTTFVMPLVLATRGDSGIPAPVGNAQPWARAADEPAKTPPRDMRLPQTDAPDSAPSAARTPVDQSAPDAAIMRSGKVRAKLIKL